MKKFLIVFVSLFLFQSGLYAAEKNNPPFEVILVIPKAHSFQERQIYKVFNHKPNFHVVLKNISDKQQKVWQEWCSWGEQVISFEVVISNKIYKVKRKPRIYEKNYPDYFTLEPEEYLVFDVYMTQDEWEGFPSVQQKTIAQIKAIYENQEQYVPLKKDIEKEPSEFEMWQGRVESKPLTVAIYGN